MNWWKHKKVCTSLNYINNFLILASTITECISISDFAFLIGIPSSGITSSGKGLKIFAVAPVIKKYKSINKKRKKTMIK